MGTCVLPTVSFPLAIRPVPHSTVKDLRSGRPRCLASRSKSQIPLLHCNRVRTAYLVGLGLRAVCIASAQQGAFPQEGRKVPKRAALDNRGKGTLWQKSELVQPVKDVPLQMTAYIKSERQQAIHAIKRDDTVRVLKQFTRRMERLCRRSPKHLNMIHVCAILNGVARVWSAAVSNRSAWTQQADAKTFLHGFLRSMLMRLQDFLPDITARAASNILWSLAKMQVNPDKLVPGIVDSLAEQFKQGTNSATGQSYATFLLACADLRLKPCDGDMLPQLLVHLTSENLSLLDRQAVVNTLHGLARLRGAKPSSQLLDNLCECCLTFLWAPQESQRPPSQEIASLAWALRKLKHVPSQQLSSGLLARMLSLCQHERKQPNAQEISNFLLGWAELRLPITQAETDALVSHALSQSLVRQQHIANVAWSLAVAERLQLDTYRQLLQQMLTLATAGNAPINTELVQMHQALHGVNHPANHTPTPQQQALWSSMQAALHSLGPVSLDTRGLGNYGLYVSLTDLGVIFKTGVLIKTYFAHAVLQPQTNTARPIIIILEYEQMDHCFSNDVTRLAGREVYCRKLLSQSGILIVVPPTIVLGGEEMLAEFLRTALKTAAGGDLNQYRIDKQ